MCEKKILLFFYKNSSANFYSLFHNFVRYFYIGPFCFLLKTLLIAANNDICHVFPRHSSKEGMANFNAFMSDLDLTIVLKNQYSQEKLRAVLKIYSELRKILKFLDVPEIYTLHEFQIQSRIYKDDNEQICSYIKMLRKIKWEHEKFNSSYHIYDKEKAKRSLLKCYQRIGISQEFIWEKGIDISHSFLDRMNLPDANFKLPPKLFSNYLNMPFYDSTAKFVTGKKQSIIILLALLPEIGFDLGTNGDFNKHIKDYRRNPMIQEKYCKNLIIELCQCLSVLRLDNFFDNAIINKNILLDFINEIRAGILTKEIEEFLDNVLIYIKRV